MLALEIGALIYQQILLQYLRDYQTFAGTARYWTETFAKTSSLGVEEKVRALILILRVVYNCMRNQIVLSLSSFFLLLWKMKKRVY